VGQDPQFRSFAFSAGVIFISSFETDLSSKFGQVFVVLQVDIWLYKNLQGAQPLSHKTYWTILSLSLFFGGVGSAATQREPWS
jgi:hypothetical protein